MINKKLYFDNKFKNNSVHFENTFKNIPVCNILDREQNSSFSPGPSSNNLSPNNFYTNLLILKTSLHIVANATIMFHDA